jgi:hypothetical protein
MVDLKRSMDGATALSPALGKEEWLRRRAASRSATGRSQPAAAGVHRYNNRDVQVAPPDGRRKCHSARDEQRAAFVRRKMPVVTGRHLLECLRVLALWAVLIGWH